jgi:hypothetical protein
MNGTGKRDDLDEVTVTDRDRSPSRILAPLGAFVLAGFLAAASAAGVPVPAVVLATFATAVALAHAVAAARMESLVPLAVRRVPIAVAGLLPLATVQLRDAIWVLLAAVLATAVSQIRRIPANLFLATSIMAAAVHMSGSGTALLNLALAALGGMTLASVILGRAQGRTALISPAEAFGTVALVSGLAVNDLARRSALAGVQLPAARWALFAIVVIALVVVTSSRAFAAVVSRVSLPVVTALVAFSMVLAPARGGADELRTDSTQENPLAALAGGIGSNSMTGEEGAGPRAQFRGVDFADCDEFSIRDCLITYFDDIATRDGVETAVNEIVDRVRNNVGTSFPTHCHQVIHNLGQLAYELTDGDFALVSSYDPQVCGTGFIHGLYERYFDRYGKLLFTDTGQICEKMNLVQDWYAWTCNHILGHTLMTKMMSNPSVATEFCMQLFEKENYHDCTSGAWMNFWADDVVLDWYQKNAMFEPEKVFNVCYGAESYTKYYCYQEIFPALSTISNNNHMLMAEWCLNYSEATRGNGPIYYQSALDFAERCMQGVARVVAVSSGYDYRVAMLKCTELIPSQADTCLTAAGASVVLNTGSVTAGNEMCERVVNKSYREFCFIWVKQTGLTLRSGPNSENMPAFGEVRIPDVDIDTPLPPKVTDRKADRQR